MQHQNHVIEGRGRIELELLPSPRFCFVMRAAQLIELSLGEAQLALPPLSAKVAVLVTNLSLGSVSAIRGTIQNASVDSGAALTVVRFLVANLPDFLGDPVAERDRSGTIKRTWAGRLTLAAQDWIVHLDQRQDVKDVYARLRAQGGFEVTHVGSLRRRDGALFTGADATDVLDGLAGFLGFASGAWAAPLAAVGFDSQGQKKWHEWKPRWDSPWRRGVLRPFDFRDHDLHKAFAGYLERWCDPLWNEPLRVATHMYVEANGPITIDTSLVLTQNALEVIAWTLFVRDLRSRKGASFDALRAEERVRDLVQWTRVSPVIPRQLTALRRDVRAQAPPWNRQRASPWDGPSAITAMRNAMTHPSITPSFSVTPVDSRIELQQLGLWYLERALLRLTGYRGPYANRLGAKMTGIVEQIS